MAVEHEKVKQADDKPKASYGYGGKFGVERDRMDKVYNFFFLTLINMLISSSYLMTLLISLSTLQAALGHDYVAQVEQHSSQKDAAKGFGGKYGVQKDRVDKVRGQEES